MSDVLGSPPGPPPAEPIDLSVLERIEGELDAVERALEQIDQGVFDGFPGLGQVADRADTTAGAGAQPSQVRDQPTGTDALAPGDPADPG